MANRMRSMEMRKLPFDKARLEEIASKWPTPFHIYDAKAIKANAKRLKKARRSKTYKMGLQGYSHYRVIACELSTETVIHNYMGDMMKKSMQNIFVNNAET